jgi:predicted ATPase
MNRVPILDREKEIELFESIARGERADSCILLIESESGWGKSTLLREFARRCKDGSIKKSLICGSMDLKISGLELPDILSLLCDSIGWPYFPVLKSKFASRDNSSGVAISKNIFIGVDQEVQVAFSQNDSLPLRTILTNTFISELEKIKGKRVVLLFDSFERANDNIKVWISGLLLPLICRSKNIVAVIAGQQVPEPDNNWDGEHFSLGGIPSVYWYNRAHSEGAGVSKDFIDGCCFITKEQPIKMAMVLHAVMSETSYETK